jgi:hypothetical protein
MTPAGGMRMRAEFDSDLGCDSSYLPHNHASRHDYPLTTSSRVVLPCHHLTCMHPQYGTSVGSRLYLLDDRSDSRYKVFHLKNREFTMDVVCLSAQKSRLLSYVAISLTRVLFIVCSATAATGRVEAAMWPQWRRVLCRDGCRWYVHARVSVLCIRAHKF